MYHGGVYSPGVLAEGGDRAGDGGVGVVRRGGVGGQEVLELHRNRRPGGREDITQYLLV